MRPDRDQRALQDMLDHARRVALLVEERSRSDVEVLSSAIPNQSPRGRFARQPEVKA